MKLTTPITAKLVAKVSARLGEVSLIRSFFGSQLTNGGGNWGFTLDRAMGDTYALANRATLDKGYLWIIPLSGSGSTNIKMGVYTDNAGAAGTLVAISSPTLVSSSGWAEFSFAGQVLEPGNYHIIAVSSVVGGAGWDMGSRSSGGLPAARIYTTFSYASPPTTAAAPDNQYNNGLAVSITYTY